MAKKDKTDRKSFEDMRAEREAEVKSSLEAASDRMADAQGEAMLANIGRRVDEVKGEEERKRNYHLLQASAIRENENSRVKNTSVNVGAPQAPLNFEPEEISDNADRTFKRGMNKNQYGVRQDFSKRALAAEAEAVKAASDRMADAQGDAIMNNINNHIAKRERDAAEREAAEQRKAKYLSDQQAAIRANQKLMEKPAAPANNEPENSANTEAQNNKDERIEAGRATRTEAHGNAEAQENTGKRVEAGRAARAGAQEGNASNKAGRPAPLAVHNAEERFQKNLEDVQGKLKYEPILEIIRKYQEEQQRLADNRTPEQKKKDARREKMAKIFAALGDGVAAMSNLVLTSKGAIPYQSKSSLSKAVGDRYDKFRKDLEERRAKSLALSERIAQLRQGVEDRKAEDERFEYQRKRQEVEDKRKEELHGLTVAGQNLKNQYTQAQIDDIAARRDYQNKVLEVRKAIAQIRAQAQLKAARTRGAGGGSGKTWKLLDKTYRNLDEYKAAVEEAALELGISDYNTVEYQSGYKTSERVMPKSIAQKAAEIARKSKESNGTQGGKWGFSIHKK